MFRESLCDCGHGVHLLAAPQTLDDVQQVTTDGVEQVMEFARGSFDFVVVDLEDFFHREQFRVLQLSDAILFTFRLNFNGLRNTRRTLEFLRRAGIDDQKVHLVANQAGRAKELSAAQAEDALQREIGYFIPDDPKTQNHALNSGVPAVIDNPRSKLAKAIKQLTSVRSHKVVK
jgi:pilus assembly protein CpaE